MKKRDVPLVLFAIAAVFFLITAVNLVELGGKKVTGKASAVAMLGLTVLGDQQVLNLTNGWNFVSFYVALDNYNVTDVLASIDGQYDYIQEWDGSSQDFSIWSRSGQKDFTEFNKNKSYFIYANQNTQVILNGRYFDNWTIALLPGWETPDYVFYYSSNITSNAPFHNASFSYMQKWNSSSQDFMVYSPWSIAHDFDKVHGGEGYVIRTEGGQIAYVFELP